MILQLARAKRRQVLVDINTQRDFLLAEGIVCIRNHRRVLSHIRRMMAWARGSNVPIISASEVHPNYNGNGNGNGHHNGDGNGNGAVHYCIDGTNGQKKVRYTLVHNRIVFPADGNTDLPRDMLRQYQQIVLHKRCVDPFDEPRIDRLLSEVLAREFVLIGACAEGAVQAAALGLLQRHKMVTVVVDAVGYHDSREAKMAFRKMEAKGARLIETKKIAGVSHLRQVGVCSCESCRRVGQKLSIHEAD